MKIMEQRECSYCQNTGTRILLIYSPDDNGYYWQRTDNHAVSQVLPTREKAYTAVKRRLLVWTKD